MIVGFMELKATPVIVVVPKQIQSLFYAIKKDFATSL